MKIEFNHIIPLPLKQTKHDSKSIWGSKLVWESPQKTILNAVSGKGKSTFVDVLTGVRNDYEGIVKFDGKPIKDFTSTDWSRYRTSKIATVYQDLQLFDDLSVLDNVLVKNELTSHLTLDEIITLLYRLGVDSLKDKVCKNLSYGQKQRVAIVRALAQPFELLILDEPFSHLDKVNESVAIDILLEACENNEGGFIMTTLGELPNCDFDNELML
jgi:ABC-type lipoprotein export system ATPase subunit